VVVDIDENENEEKEQETTLTTAMKSVKAQLSLPSTENVRRSLKKAMRLTARSTSQFDSSPLNDDIDFNIQLKNVGEVAAMALLKHRIQRGSITSADVPLAFRRNATVLRDIKNVALYHQYMKKSLDQKSTSGLYRTSGDSRASTGHRSFGWSASSQQSVSK